MAWQHAEPPSSGRLTPSHIQDRRDSRLGPVIKSAFDFVKTLVYDQLTVSLDRTEVAVQHSR